ncbi:metallophosphoesterase [Pseudogemmobacter sonorensis]|uniref:metallophosphoesterase n=1 Tax=Pseudogemmobacter sonorensis TaxID=2989681 RepID=UPI0036A8289C
MNIAHISDLHLIEGTAPVGLTRGDAVARARRLVADLNACRPALDLVVITGDNVNDARPGEYAILRDLLADLTVPFVILPGNHDDRALLRESFPDQGWADPALLFQERIQGPLRLLALDSLDPGRIGGVLEGAQLDWIEDRLARPFAGLTMIALHHPPLPTRMGALDRNLLDEGAAARLLAAIARLAGPVPVLCGHMHRPFAILHGNAVILAATSTAAQFALEPQGPADPVPVDEPYGYAIHLIGPAPGHVIHRRFPPL